MIIHDGFDDERGPYRMSEFQLVFSMKVCGVDHDKAVLRVTSNSCAYPSLFLLDKSAFAIPLFVEH